MKQEHLSTGAKITSLPSYRSDDNKNTFLPEAGGTRTPSYRSDDNKNTFLPEAVVFFDLIHYAVLAIIGTVTLIFSTPIIFF